MLLHAPWESCTSRMTDKVAYTVQEVAILTGWSRQTVTRLFENERGVRILERPGSLNKRKFRSIRIPRAVYERVISKLTVK